MEGESVHSRLCIPVCGGGIAVNITEVSVTVYKGITQRKILRHTHHSVINAGVAVGVVGAQHRTYGVRALAVRLVGSKSVFIHCVKYSSVNRF